MTLLQTIHNIKYLFIVYNMNLKYFFGKIIYYYEITSSKSKGKIFLTFFYLLLAMLCNFPKSISPSTVECERKVEKKLKQDLF